MRRLVSLALAAVCSLGFAVPVATSTAHATESIAPFAHCSSSTWDVSITNLRTAYIPGSARVYGSPGSVLTIQEGTSTVTGTMSGTVSAEAGAIFTRASATAGVSLAQSTTITTTISVSGTVPAGAETAYIELGSYGRSFNVTLTRYNSNCMVLERKSGSASGATTSPYDYLSWSGFHG